MITIVDGLPYPVAIAADAAAEIRAHLAGVSSAILVADKQVSARAHAIEGAVRAASVTVQSTIATPAGESLKTMAAVEELCDLIVAARADRGTVLIAVGGGTLTDAAGFAAAICLRGLAWIAVPTTTLGMVDAAIGGKTGVDLRAGKNLAGVFWNPLAVVADLMSLETLPARQRGAGLAEALKAAVIGDAGLFELLERFDVGAEPPAWRPVIAKAAAVKARLVAADPREAGPREALNLGHTFAHAIEAASGYAVPHGEAVAVGLRAAGALARALRTGWTQDDQQRLVGALRSANLPVDVADLAPDAIVEAMGADKKRRDARLRFVLPERIGRVRVGVDADADTVLAATSAICCGRGSAAARPGA